MKKLFCVINFFFVIKDRLTIYVCMEINFYFRTKLSNFRFFLKLYFSLIDFFAISLVQPAAGIRDNSPSPEDNQVKFMDWRKTRGSQKPKSDLQMETPKIKGKASSNLFKLHFLPNKYSPHDSRDSALPKPKPNSYWETNVVCLTSYRKPVAAPSKRKKKTSYLAKERIYSSQHNILVNALQDKAQVLSL